MGVAAQFYSMELWLCRAQSARAQRQGVLPFSCLGSAAPCWALQYPIREPVKKLSNVLLLIAKVHLICKLHPLLQKVERHRYLNFHVA